MKTKVLRLALLGSPDIRWGDQPLAGLTSAKALGLLAYLAVTGRPHARQALAGLLWSDMPEADARRNLRGDLMKLRQVIAPYLLANHQDLSFDRTQPYWLDVEQLTGALDGQGRQPDPVRLSQAADLYRGEFLEGLHLRQAPRFESWLMQQRRLYRERAARAWQLLCDHYQQAGRWEAALSAAERWLELDILDEAGHRQLMWLLAATGQRNAALAHYDACRQLLLQELNVEPVAETTALWKQIRSGQFSAGVAAAPAKPAAASQQMEARGAGAAPRDVRIEAEAPLFIVGPPVAVPARFFGRRRELKRLFNLFRQAPLQNAAVIGPRRSGKTSLLHYMRQVTTADSSRLRPQQKCDWLPEPERYRWIYVDFQDPRLGERTGLLQYLSQQMDLPMPHPGNMELFMEVVGDGLHAPTIILMDEIGVALTRYAELDDAFWEGLRSLATNQVRGNLGFVLASSQSPAMLAGSQGLGSPFFNIFGYTAMLGPLTEAEARELIGTIPYPVPEAELRWILERSRRWPIQLQILCREFLFAYEEGIRDASWHAEALRQLVPFEEISSGSDASN